MSLKLESVPVPPAPQTSRAKRGGGTRNVFRRSSTAFCASRSARAGRQKGDRVTHISVSFAESSQPGALPTRRPSDKELRRSTGQLRIHRHVRRRQLRLRRLAAWCDISGRKGSRWHRRAGGGHAIPEHADRFVLNGKTPETRLLATGPTATAHVSPYVPHCKHARGVRSRPAGETYI